ncbi:hypothetical protein HK105_203049 [Polyrhizophydium stewartii]|uniref:Uncharacterized protein n=1 Tax=Polyrhizophydium stewartii TaxID=2732419 RepID=A0ABR4NCZ2_9FUNG|nr:hypothetical protein HK105_007897 [Polyrhizophydium stewartii]
MPLDWLMLAGEWWAGLDKEALFARASFPLAALCNLLYLLIKVYRDEVLTDADELLALSRASKTWLEELSPQPAASLLGALWSGKSISPFTMIELVLVGISVVNTVVMFTRSRSIVLFKQPTQPRYPGDTQWIVRSRNAKICKVQTAHDFGEVDDASAAAAAAASPPRSQQPKAPGSVLARLWSLLLEKPKSLSGQADGDGTEDKWVVRVWNPSDGSLSLFCWFSPPQVAILYGTNLSNWYFYLPVAYLTAFMMFMLVSFFQDRLADQQILSGQLLHEFTETFVYQQPPFRPHTSTAVGDDEQTIDDYDGSYLGDAHDPHLDQSGSPARTAVGGSTLSSTHVASRSAFMRLDANAETLEAHDPDDQPSEFE